MAMRGFWAVLVLAPLVLATEGTARADEPVSLGPGLRPYIHTDRYGRTLVDVCPERVFGGPRCFSQRILRPGTPRPVPLSGGSSCSPTGGGGSGSPPPGSMTPSDIVAAYKIPSTAHANGAIVALAELPSTHAMTDVNTYRAAFGIPALPACPMDSKGIPTPGGTACFARVGFNSGTGAVTAPSATDCPGWAGEVGLDMDMVSAACPDCSIVLVEGDPSTFNLVDANAVAATAIGAAAVSNSWGAQEYAGENGTPDELASPNILVFAASGDNGYDNEYPGWGTPSYPASDPHVIAVGGTTLQHKGGAYSEVVWDDGFSTSSPANGAGGSGCSLLFSMPTYQSSSGISFGSCTKRASVDLSAAAEFCPPVGCVYGGGIAAYDIDDSGWGSVVGTSAASPLVAALMVRVGLAGKDNHTLFYANAGAFNDITSGNNDPKGTCGGTIMCTAGPGWDGPTGLGTPNGGALFALAGGVSPPPPDSGAPPPTDGGTPPTDGATSPDGSKPPPPPGTIGAPCTLPTDCNAPNKCVTSGTGKDSVCAPVCAATSNCPSGYECNGGFCFADPPMGTKSGSDPKNSTGCGCTTASSSSSPWAGMGFLTLGLLAFKRRRR